MPVSKGLRRLQRIRELEEEQSRVALESALAHQRRLQEVQRAAVARARMGRELITASAAKADTTDRRAGEEEVRAAERVDRVLSPRLEASERETALGRGEYLDRRVRKRQVEALIQEAEGRDAVKAERRSQQDLDDWFRNRLFSKG